MREVVCLPRHLVNSWQENLIDGSDNVKLESRELQSWTLTLYLKCRVN